MAQQVCVCACSASQVCGNIHTAFYGLAGLTHWSRRKSSMRGEDTMMSTLLTIRPNY